MPTKTNVSAKAKPNAPAKKATAVALCRPSAITREAARDLRVHGDKVAGKYLATVSKKQKSACEKGKGLAGAPETEKKAHGLTPGQKANKRRMKMITRAAGAIYDKPNFKGDWIDATKKASNQLKRAGKL